MLFFKILNIVELQKFVMFLLIVSARLNRLTLFFQSVRKSLIGGVNIIIYYGFHEREYRIKSFAVCEIEKLRKLK